MLGNADRVLPSRDSISRASGATREQPEPVISGGSSSDWPLSAASVPYGTTENLQTGPGNTIHRPSGD